MTYRPGAGKLGGPETERKLEGGFAVGATSRRQGPNKAKQKNARRRRRAMAILASALVTLPVGLASDVAFNYVNAADQTPLGVPKPHPLPKGDAVPSALGATGEAPHDTQLSPTLIHDAGNPAALATGAGPQADLPSGPLGIPGVVLDAYLHAQQVMSVQDAGCKLPWWLLAGIGKIESNQAEGGEVDTNGTTLRPILGPELNGSNGFAAIPAINGGQWTGDPVWQRAVGPMQFLPSTWLAWGDGGNPNNVYDSALAAGRYLCAGGGDLSQPADQAAAVFSYNHSNSYVQIVLLWANAYHNGVTPLPETTVLPQGPMPVGTPTGPTGVVAVPTTQTAPTTGGGTTTGSPTGTPGGSTSTGGSPTTTGTSTGSGSGGQTQVTTTPTMTTPPTTTTPTCTPAPTTTTTTTGTTTTTTTTPAPTTTTTTPPTTTTTTTSPPPPPSC
jgi:hypothetical protein